MFTSGGGGGEGCTCTVDVIIGKQKLPRKTDLQKSVAQKISIPTVSKGDSSPHISPFYARGSGNSTNEQVLENTNCYRIISELWFY